MSSKRILNFLLLGLSVATLLAACGDSTATTAPATSAAVQTTAAATTASATTAVAATTAAQITAAGTTTAAATTAAQTTAAATSSSADGADQAGIYPFQKYSPLPAGAKKGGNLNWVSLGKQLVPDLHPYPQNVNYTNSWTDVAT